MGDMSPPPSLSMMKGNPCWVLVPLSRAGFQIPLLLVNCRALPVVVWPFLVIGGAQGPDAKDPLVCQSNQ